MSEEKERSDIRKCTLCGKSITNTEMAVNSHLQKHINSGELKPEDRLATRMKILGREMYKHQSRPVKGGYLR